MKFLAWIREQITANLNGDISDEELKKILVKKVGYSESSIERLKAIVRGETVRTNILPTAFKIDTHEEDRLNYDEV